MPTQRSEKLRTISLVALVIVSYLPALHGGFIWDDDVYVEHNQALRSAAGLWRIWTDPSATPQYYPLTHTTFWIEYHLWGASSAVGYHIDNVLLHALGAVLLMRLLKRLAVPRPWLIAAIFAVHPINVESVAWITERKNVLSGVFYFLAFGTWMKYEDGGWRMEGGRKTEDGGWRMKDGKEFSPPSSILHLLSSFLFFLLALFSKTVTATLPAAMLLVIWWKRGKIRLKDVLPLLPFFAAGIAMAAVTGHLEQAQVGAHGTEWMLTPADRITVAGRAIWFYAEKLAWPRHLSFIYPRWNPPLSWAWPAAVIAVIAALWLLRNRLGRGPLTAVLFFVGTLTPALGFVNVYPMRYSFVADHFQYLAGIGLIALFVGALNPFLRWPIAALILAILATLTFHRQFVYHDRETLWRDTIAKNPNSWMAHTNLGHALHARADDADAEVEYRLALRLDPNVPDTHLNVAIADAIHGDLDGTIRECQEAVAIDADFAPGYANMAKAYRQQGKISEAAAAAEKAVRCGPGFALGHLEWGRALQMQGNSARAADELAAGLAIDPSDVQARMLLADCLEKMGRHGEAIQQYQRAMESGAYPKN